MSGNLFFAIIVGIVVLGGLYAVYWTVVVQPRLRNQIKEQAEKHGWTYIPGKSVVVNKFSKGYLISPQESISDSIQGSTQGIKWRIDGVTVTGKYATPVRRANGGIDSAAPSSVYQIIWHSEDVRIEHGSVLLFLKPEGGGQSAGVGGMVRAGVKSVYSGMIHDLMRKTFGIQNTPIELHVPEFDAKYQIEVSDVGAAQVALTGDVRDFLIKQRPPAELIQLGDNALDIVAENATYFKKIEHFDKLASLADYGVQLAQVVAASQNATASQKS